MIVKRMWTVRLRRLILSNNLLRWNRTRNMSNTLAVKDPEQLLPPLEVKGMLKMDKEKFGKLIVVPWLEIDEKQVSVGMNVLKKYLLKIAKFKPLRPAFELLEGEEVMGSPNESVSTGSPKRVFLNPTLVGNADDFDEGDQEKLKKIGVSLNLRYSKINIGYENWRADEILKAILPEENDNLSGYSIIGHIVHVNLRDHHLPFKKVIGEVLLDKVSGAKTVVNKTDIIDSTYRNFKMEVLCGSDEMVTRTKENGCVFELDFSKVYWNPRLATEHERITSKLKCDDILYDVFAGVGPFSIPSGKKKCSVLANDLNPESYRWLNENCKLNKVQHFVRTFNEDGKTFITNQVKNDMIKRLNSNKLGKGTIHITMNLPASAVSFLSAFSGLFSSENVFKRNQKLPIVHVYCFVSSDNPETAARTLVEENLDCKLGENVKEVCLVRNVSPNKDMMRVSFVLPMCVLIKNGEDTKCIESDEGAPSAKRICLSNEITCSN